MQTYHHICITIFHINWTASTVILCSFFFFFFNFKLQCLFAWTCGLTMIFGIANGPNSSICFDSVFPFECSHMTSIVSGLPKVTYHTCQKLIHRLFCCRFLYDNASLDLTPDITRSLQPSTYFRLWLSVFLYLESIFYTQQHKINCIRFIKIINRLLLIFCILKYLVQT